MADTTPGQMIQGGIRKVAEDKPANKPLSRLPPQFLPLFQVELLSNFPQQSNVMGPCNPDKLFHPGFLAVSVLITTMEN